MNKYLTLSAVFLVIFLSARAREVYMDEGKDVMRGEGSFKVELTPLDSPDPQADNKMARMGISKTFEGDLSASSKGQMLSAMTSVKGSAGYVAQELVEGSLNGRKGSFVLQHSGTMSAGSQELTVTVVPDSGTGELVGLSGKMQIHIKDGVHTYTFDYTLP